MEEQQQQEEARARSEMITRLIEEQSRAVRQLQQEEDDEQKRKEQPRSPKKSVSSTTGKKKNTHKSNPDDGCSICLIPVRSSLLQRLVSFRPLTMHHTIFFKFILCRTTNDRRIGLMNLSISCVIKDPLFCSCVNVNRVH